MTIKELHQMVILIYASEHLPKHLISSIDFYLDGGSKEALIEQINSANIYNLTKKRLKTYL